MFQAVAYLYSRYLTMHYQSVKVQLLSASCFISLCCKQNLAGRLDGEKEVEGGRALMIRDRERRNI